MDDGHNETCVRIDGDADVVPIEKDDVVILDPSVQLGKLHEACRDGMQSARDEQLEVDAREVALLDERDRRDLPVGALDLLHDRATNPAHGDPAALAWADGSPDIRLRHPPGGPRSGHRREVDAELAREPVQGERLERLGTDHRDVRPGRCIVCGWRRDGMEELLAALADQRQGCSDPR